jgi:hypothetical protein
MCEGDTGHGFILAESNTGTQFMADSPCATGCVYQPRKISRMAPEQCEQRAMLGCEMLRALTCHVPPTTTNKKNPTMNALMPGPSLFFACGNKKRLSGCIKHLEAHSADTQYKRESNRSTTSRSLATTPRLPAT